MPWGIFERDDVLHVAPCDGDNYIRSPHILSPECPCHPAPDVADDGTPMFIHEEIN